MRAADADGEAMVCVHGMSEPHPNPGCTSLECRVRHALRADDRPPAGDTIDVDAVAALEVLCRVSAELLAHYPPTNTTAFYFNLLVWRDRWKKDALVMAQQEPQGRA
jgi:hypothetical protein